MAVIVIMWQDSVLKPATSINISSNSNKLLKKEDEAEATIY
jgi:hypothetical protein